MSKLHSKHPRAFWGIPFTKTIFFSNLVCIFSQNFSNFGETFQKNRQHAFYLSSGTLLEKQYGRNVLNCRWSLLGMLSKLQFTCSQEHFEKGYFFRIFQNCFRTLSVNRPDLAKSFSSVSKYAFYVSEGLLCFFCEWFSCFI